MTHRRRKRFEEEMDAELRFHMDSYAADLMRSGVSREEAERRARLEFGAMEARKDECRQAWGWQRMDELRADLRLLGRTVRRNPGFAAVAILSLALGIGANTAIFGVFDAVMLRLLPVREPERLVFLHVAGRSGVDGPPYPLYELIREQARSFEAVAAFSPSGMEVRTERGREQARGVWVSGNFYETLGVRPLMGRGIDASDDRTSGTESGAVVISRDYWRRRFGGDPAIIGRPLYLFDHPVTIAGVLPGEVMSVEPGRPIDIAAPMALSSPEKMRDRAALWLFAVGRLKPGVTTGQALAETESFFRSYMADVKLPEGVRERLFRRMRLDPAGAGLPGLRGRFSRPLTALMLLAGLVLVAACVNMTNLMLARAMAGQRDAALRRAIGAGRGRLMQQHLTECVGLAAAGALLGVVFAHLGQSALAAFLAEGGSRIILNLSLNGRVLLFAAGLTLLTAAALGIVPALRAARQDPALGLQGGSRGIAGERRSMKLGRALVVAQVAVSMAVLAGAGLFIRTLAGLRSVDLGFERQGILTLEAAPERALNGTPEWLARQAALLENIRRIPGIRAAGWATMNPMSGRDRGALVEVPGFTASAESDKEIHLAAVSPGYFDALGVRLMLGRDITDRDHAGASKVALVNETAARFYFGEASPIGRKVRFTNYDARDLVYEVVGVVGDVKHDSLRQAPPRFIYLPLPQHVDRLNRLALAARCTGDPAALAALLQERIRSDSATLLITNVTTMEKQIDESLTRERLVAALSAAFGGVSLTLAGIGLYGILAYGVARRRNELGIRMAVGATRGGVLWLVMREALALTAAGILIGVPAVIGLGRVVRAALFGVGPGDAAAIAGAAGLLLVFAVIAAAGPGRRAASLDPVAALRRE